ncbi:hypothetical protein AB835_02045 [Candidatus Endobugula sertula]|uniref:Uncharacterized protein n=1 Tax=Candidatus Endobugula sertula TaxID=62101 RepID=A0A1D2QSV9_9GAMM|nr:hypothetical protein AB835_02045 [Candidatus Endobugula sertula]
MKENLKIKYLTKILRCFFILSMTIGANCFNAANALAATPSLSEINHIEVDLIEPPSTGSNAEMYANGIQQTPLAVKIYMKDGHYVPDVPSDYFLPHLTFYQENTHDVFGINHFKNHVNLTTNKNDYVHGVFNPNKNNIVSVFATPPSHPPYTTLSTSNSGACNQANNCYLLNLYFQTDQPKLYSICTDISDNSLITTCGPSSDSPTRINARTPLQYNGNMFSINNATMEWILNNTTLYIWTHYSYKVDRTIPKLRQFVFPDAKGDSVANCQGRTRNHLSNCATVSYKAMVSPGIYSTRAFTILSEADTQGQYDREVITYSVIPNEGYGPHGYTRTVPLYILDEYGNGSHTTTKAC